jgi:hypothetical protein
LPENPFLQTTFSQAYREASGQRETPPFIVQFYPYSGLNNTIRIRKGKVHIRISDALTGAPDRILTSIIVILLHRLFRRPVPEREAAIYREYVRCPEMRQRVRLIREQRGTRYFTHPAGHVFDLRDLFNQVNRDYFSGELQIRHLSWSRRRSRRVLAHFEPGLQAIVVNRRLDNPKVPRYVLEFVLYHEMLHLMFGECRQNGRRRLHHPDFRAAERVFPHYRQAKDFIRSRKW